MLSGASKIVSPRCEWARVTLHTPGSSLFNKIGGRSAVRIRIRIRIRIRFRIRLRIRFRIRNKV